MHPSLLFTKILVYFSAKLCYNTLSGLPADGCGGPLDGFWRQRGAHHISKTRQRELCGEGGPSPTGDAGPEGEGAHVLARFWRTFVRLCLHTYPPLKFCMKKRSV